ncbi:MAG TPA: hypothetical protein VHD83_20465 [Puia sp.]|nr:hypothetical protein [Puia sp.]
MLLKAAKKVRNLLNLPLKVEGLRPVEILDIKHPKVIAGRTLANLNNHIFKQVNRLSDVEFQVYSQWGDDGIIQWLINKVDMPNKTFVEFGVQDYTESNTRFLLVNNQWEGLVMDGSEKYMNFVKNDRISNHHHIHAKNVFITRENINQLLSNLPFDKPLDILSIDIDGNDYYIWKEVNVVNPILVISEYNAIFGLNPWTIPYKADFVRPYDNPTMIFYGTSLQSLCDLAEEKGYYFIGCNSAGNNAYFLRKDKIGDIKPLTAAEGFETAKFRETRDERGEWIADKDRFRVVDQMEVYNTRTRSVEKFTS